MIKYVLLAALSLSAAAAVAQASAPEASASSASKPKWVKKFKHHKPAQPAVNPQTSPDKKGGN